MKLRNSFLITTVLFTLVANAVSHPVEPAIKTYKLEKEPLVRIGLLRNSSSVLISTRDSSLVAVSDLNSNQYLGTTSVRISARGYRTPVYVTYRFEIQDIKTREEAENLANKVKAATQENAVAIIGATTNVWKVRIGQELENLAQAKTFKNSLIEKGVEKVVITTEKYTSPSDAAIELSQQISNNSKSKVRSLLSSRPTNAGSNPTGVKTIGSSRPIGRKNKNAPIRSNLREVIVSGKTPAAKFSSLKPVVIGSATSRGIIRLNGKRYRGKMEVFVNSKGRLTVVNVVPMEDYLLGVVPAELSLPQIEAQKAQAVAARTYAVANKNGYGDEGFDMLPTVWSQVYKGVRIESRMGSQAVRETRGIIATYKGKAINALYTSTCGGRTEDSGNIFEFDEPYLRGVNCSLDGKKHFVPFLIKSSREPALVRNEANYTLVRLASKLAVNNFLMVTNRFDDDYFEDSPTETELKSWLNQLAVKFGKPFPIADAETAKPLKLARVLHSLIYAPKSAENADALLSESDIEYQLSFWDANEIPKRDRPMLAELIRDGWFSIYSDLTIKPKKSYSRTKILNLIKHIYDQKKWTLTFQTGTAKPTEDGKLILRVGRREKEITVNQNLFLFRKFGNEYYQVKEAALVGGEKIRYKTNGAGEAIYIEVAPIKKTTVAERMSPFTNWRKRLSASQVRARLGRYVKGLGTLIDVRIKTKGFSRRPTELEIITTNGAHSLKGGKIRSALRLREQLFVMNKRYGSNGRVVSYNFTGRGWGHGVGMCQYGAYGFAQMGLKYDRILKHYYSKIDLTQAY